MNTNIKMLSAKPEYMARTAQMRAFGFLSVLLGLLTLVILTAAITQGGTAWIVLLGIGLVTGVCVMRLVGAARRVSAGCRPIDDTARSELRAARNTAKQH